MQNTGAEKILILGRDTATSQSRPDIVSEELQSCLAVLQEGLDVVLLSNATSLTNRLKTVLDVPIYNMPLCKESVIEIVDKEIPDVVYAPFWGSSGWQLLRKLGKEGYWQKNVIRTVGLYGNSSFQAKRRAIKKADAKHIRTHEVHSLKEAEKRMEELGGTPLLLRTEQAEVVYIDSEEEFRARVLVELDKSSKGNIVLEEAIAGSKEIEVGVLRDTNGFTQAVYTSENILPTRFDSNQAMSVSPIQSLGEKQTKALTDSALKVAAKLVDFAGYCTIQLLQSPDKGTLISDIKFELPKSPAVISLAMGCSVINVKTKLALGHPLKDLSINTGTQIRQQERVIFKVPEFNTNSTTYSDQSGNQEYIYAGQNFCETFVKAIEENSINREQNNCSKLSSMTIKNQMEKHSIPDLDLISQAFADGMSIREIALITNLDTWFLTKIKLVGELQQKLLRKELKAFNKEEFSLFKTCGFSDKYMASLMSYEDKKITEAEVRKRRRFMKIPAVTVLQFERDLKKSNCKRKILILSSSKVYSNPLQFPAIVLVQEARRMGFEVMLMTKDMDAVSFWMAFVDQIYVDSPNKENISEIHRCEKPSAVFIEGDGLLPGYLEKYMTEIGLTTVKVPLRLPDQLSNTNGTH